MATGYVIRTLVPTVSLYDIVYPSTANLSGKQYLFVKDTGSAIAVASTGEKTLGVLQDGFDGSVRANVATVRTVGLSKVIAGGTVNVGDFVKSDANGAAITVTPGDEYQGYALDGGTAGTAIVIVVEHGTTHA